MVVLGFLEWKRRHIQWNGLCGISLSNFRATLYILHTAYTIYLCFILVYFKEYQLPLGFS